jgi:hypothetical protein
VVLFALPLACRSTEAPATGLGGSPGAPTPNGGSGGGGAAGGQAGAAGTGGPVSAGPSTCAELAATACQAFANCSQFAFHLTYADLDDCTTMTKGSCEYSAAAGRPTDMAACARALAIPQCNAILARLQIPEVCRFGPGPGAPGTACGRNQDCASLTCDKKLACGTCLALGVENAPCDADSPCVTGLICSAGNCAKPVAPGSPCVLGGDSRCIYWTFCINNVCAVPGTEGAPCDLVRQCSQLAGYVCSGTTCSALTVAAEGQPCNGTTTGRCPAGLFCAGGGQTAQCKRAASINQPCSDATQCRAPLVCAAGVCAYEAASTCK